MLRPIGWTYVSLRDSRRRWLRAGWVDADDADGNEVYTNALRARARAVGVSGSRAQRSSQTA